MIAGLFNLIAFALLLGGALYFTFKILVPAIQESKKRAQAAADLEVFRRQEAAREEQFRTQARRELDAEMGELPEVEVRPNQS